MKNFVTELDPVANEEGGSLLAIFDEYKYLLENDLNGYDLLTYGFNYIQRLPYWNSIKKNFIEMLVFDALIGNQDRHPFNWMVLFYPNDEIRLSPIYDNGASLGFRFEDSYLLKMIENESMMNKYMKNTKSKAGIFEKKQVKVKQLLNYLITEYPKETASIIEKINDFNITEYNNYINSLSFISEYQEKWLLKIIPFRRNKILQWVKEKERKS
ncbi:HipA domain-containing protein [Saliterribacillus persicus]|uniref:HipA-like C-terminal domain-containing protein n=1 Tax=Saliterribacillus persicus TaxID=930114 RepID=A0A368YC82_9BACI|nr:HipA domain-containing protein [Saliterribacillus persicus]RCW77289.1 hypothetical protein DFR57_101158 [Saliterribacillus persicus]